MPEATAPSSQQIKTELLMCAESFCYFADTYCHILSGQDEGGSWVKFTLWPEQFKAAKLLQSHRLLVILKARQLGLTWLVLAYALWLMLFRPAAAVLLFSRRDDEAVQLMRRLVGMYRRLPSWMQCRRIVKQSEHEMELSNGSTANAFPTTAGDSYTATLAICDEFDMVDDKGQNRLLRSVKPTIDAGGRMILLSRPDKQKPQSTFKQIYQFARSGKNGWTPVFLGWQARPDRDEAWYAAKAAEIKHDRGGLDYLHEQYPATEIEALSFVEQSKRIPPEWVSRAYVEMSPIDPSQCPALPTLDVFKPPRPGSVYILAADPAEGNPTSDDSAIEVIDADTGEEVACLAGKFEMTPFAGYIAELARWYNNAMVLVERNNHGHAVLMWLRDNSGTFVLPGLDGRPGWETNTKSKALLLAAAAELLRDQRTTLHSFPTVVQLGSIEGSTLRAPVGEHDDRAVAFCLAAAVIVYRGNPGEPDEQTVLTLR